MRAGRCRPSVVLGNIIGDLAEQDPQRAIGLIAELPSAKQANTAGSIATRWMRSDPEAAAAWALQLPEGEARKNVLSSVVNNMAIQDLTKTAGWLEQLPLGPSRDWAVREFTGRAVTADPAAATAWAATISDERLRSSEIERAASKWLGKDSDAATRWITGSTQLDEKAKKRLLPKN